jgi:WD40 repeat protein
LRVDQSRRLRGHSGDVYSIELFTGENTRRYGSLVSAGDYSLRTWKNDTVAHIFNGHTGYVSCLKVKNK